MPQELAFMVRTNLLCFIPSFVNLMTEESKKHVVWLKQGKE